MRGEYERVEQHPLEHLSNEDPIGERKRSPIRIPSNEDFVDPLTALVFGGRRRFGKVWTKIKSKKSDDGPSYRGRVEEKEQLGYRKSLPPQSLFRFWYVFGSQGSCAKDVV